jgi:hypothetical protein
VQLTADSQQHVQLTTDSQHVQLTADSQQHVQLTASSEHFQYKVSLKSLKISHPATSGSTSYQPPSSDQLFSSDQPLFFTDSHPQVIGHSRLSTLK